MKKSLDCFFGFVLVVFLMMTVLSPQKAEAAPVGEISIVSPNIGIGANWVPVVDTIDGNGNPFSDTLSLDGPNSTFFNWISGTGRWALPANNAKSPNLNLNSVEYWSFGPNTPDPVFALNFGGYSNVKITLKDEVSTFAMGNVLKFHSTAGGPPDTTIFVGPDSAGATSLINQQEIHLLLSTPTGNKFSTDAYENVPVDLGNQHFIVARDKNDHSKVYVGIEDLFRFSDRDFQDMVLSFELVPERSTYAGLAIIGIVGFKYAKYRRRRSIPQS